MYLNHFGLSEAPFRITPQTAYFFAGAQRGAMLDALLFAINHDEGIIKVTGEVGVGKTMLCRMMLERLPSEAQTIYIANPSLTPRELQETLAHELGADTTAGPTSLRWIEERLIALYADGKRVVTIIDEAHAMPRESLELVRLLSNLESSSRKLLQIVLFGQPELDTLLATREMRSLRERITQNFRLAPLGLREVGDYLRFRLQAVGYRGPDLFTGAALRHLSAASGGLTRRINILADKTLLAAFTDNTCNVGTSHVELAIRDAGYRHRSRWPIWVGGASLVALLAIAGWWFAERNARQNDGSIHQKNVEKSNIGAIKPPPFAPVGSVPLATQTATHGVPATQSSPLTTSSMRLGPRARARLDASRILIAQTAPEKWFIQLQTMTIPDADALENFLDRLDKSLDAQQLRLYETRIDSRPRVGVIYGSYATEHDVAHAIAILPDWLKLQGAYARRYAALKNI
ncbi:MAG TPA: AAA family ATPase [Rhodocyclaceae bacterium]|nr:AAA family ATPase [Rhodocyclaceae bacterium]